MDRTREFGPNREGTRYRKLTLTDILSVPYLIEGKIINSYLVNARNFNNFSPIYFYYYGETAKVWLES